MSCCEVADDKISLSLCKIILHGIADNPVCDFASCYTCGKAYLCWSIKSSVKFCLLPHDMLCSAPCFKSLLFNWLQVFYLIKFFGSAFASTLMAMVDVACITWAAIVVYVFH